MKLQINASDKDDSNKRNKAIADAYRNKFIIPLDFEMLDSVMPYYQSGLGNRLSYKIMFNNYNRVIISLTAPSPLKIPGPKYMITDVSLEYEIVTESDLVSSIAMEYESMTLPYDKTLRNRQIPLNMIDKIWSYSFNMRCKSLKGILVLFEEEELYK